MADSTRTARHRQGLVAFESEPEPLPRPLPAATTVFAVGDVHGHLHHLEAMLALLAPMIDAAAAAGDEVHLVLLGDFVDRGPASWDVLAMVDGLDRRIGVPVHCLRGNHDDFVIDLLLAPHPSRSRFATWMNNGGAATLAEVGFGYADLDQDDLPRLRDRLRARLSTSVMSGLAMLQPVWGCGDWLFVHAGIDPLVPLASQDPATWLSMREPFLTPPAWHHDLSVVHGHTIRGPEILPHRIGLDSGVYKTGVLTSVEMSGCHARFRCVSDRSDLGKFEALPWRTQQRRFGRPAPLDAGPPRRRADAA